jgi:hypothetical protein
MEQLVIFLLFVVGSIISTVIQSKKKKAEELQQRELEALTQSPRTQTAPPKRAYGSWPKTAVDWQEQLRRMLEGETAPPPVIRPVLLPPQSRPPRPPSLVRENPRPQRELSEGDLVFQTPLRASGENYRRASNLHSAVQERMRAIDLQTSTAKASGVPPRAHVHSEFIGRLKRNPNAMREAFIANVIFAPPKSLESAELEVGR